MKFDQHPAVTAVIQKYLFIYGDLFICSGTLENPAPVSVNHLYSNFRGRQVLTKAGRAYKDALASVVARSSTEWKAAVDAVYKEGRPATLLVGLYFKSLKNGAWKPGTRTPKGALSEPRQKQDSSNYLKVIEDAVSQGSGIDDRNNIIHIIVKEEDKVRPRTEFIYIVTPA